MRCFMAFIKVLLILVLVRCAPPVAIGTFSPEIDVQLKNLRPPRDKALIYVIRYDPLIREKKVQITCDGEFMGYTLGFTYLTFLADPGLHIFTSEDSMRIVDDFSAFFKKRESNKLKILSSENENKRTEKETNAHILFIKKINYIMQCLRKQTCNPDEMNRIIKNKPMPLEMYHSLAVEGGKVYFLSQTFQSGLNYPKYMLNGFDSDQGRALLKNLRHTRYVNYKVFPKDQIKLSNR